MSPPSTSEVSFKVGGRKYTVACAEGEEEQVASLGAVIDGKLDQLGGNLAPQEAQNLLFAALLLADELREAKPLLGKAEQLQADADASAKEIEQLRADLAEQRGRAEAAEVQSEARDSASAPSPPPAADDPNLAPALERFAEMLEECADKLEGKAQAS